MAKLVDVGSLASYFESLDDPRHTRNRKHLLVDIVVITVCAIICGCDGPTAIHRWAKHRQSWLAQHLALPNGISSRDCIRRLLIVLKPEAFQRCFQAWISDTILAHVNDPDRLVAIDGKACRGSHDHAKDLGALHIVSAWATEEGIALGQVATDAKSNEITAIPLLLEQIDLKGTLITIDAMGCQKEIVKQIVVGGGDCVIAVKDNQPKLSEAIQTFFLDHMESDLKKLEHRPHETHEDGHGRIEDRYYYLAEVPPDFACRKDWPWVKAIGCTIRMTRHADGSETDEVRYYLSSRYLSGQRFAEAVRGHWGIESMHWVLDVNFREDDSRTRELACDSLAAWWEDHGRATYPKAKKLLVLCDGGGSNSASRYGFKEQLQKLSTRLGLEIRVAHYPPYCSKSNPIEHWLFPHVTRACLGVIFRTLETVRYDMAKAETSTGLKTRVRVLEKVYETGRKCAEGFKETMKIVFDEFLPKWNYRVIPEPM